MIGLNVTLGSPDKKKVLVVSHARSGTHFLMNTLADNFGYISSPWIDIDWPELINPHHTDSFWAFLKMVKGRPILNTFKTHFPAEFFQPVLGEYLKEFHIFYIYRELHATMESFCRHLKDLDWFEGPRLPSGKELMKWPPVGGMLRYQSCQYPTILDRWKDHLRGWTTELPPGCREKIIYIRFQDLQNRFEQTVKKIAFELGYFPRRIVRPSKTDRVVTPRVAWKDTIYKYEHIECRRKRA